MTQHNHFLTLSNGITIPSVGFGTYKATDGDEAYNSVLTALKAGYRHIDTAAIYGNEESVGRAIQDSGIAREDIFVTTKLWNDAHSYDKAKAAIATSLKKLNLHYVDLYLIHWPNPIAFRDHWEDANAQTWKAIEEAYHDGLCRSIGVSNFMPHHLDALAKTATVLPMVNQIRLAPGVFQQEAVDYCREHHILLEAWSPLGHGEIFSHDTMNAIAAKHHKTVAQIALAWSLQEGFLPLPKSVTPSRIVENLDVFDITLSEDDMVAIRTITGVTGAANPDETNF